MLWQKQCSLKAMNKKASYIEPIASVISLARLTVKRFHYQHSAPPLIGALI